MYNVTVTVLCKSLETPANFLIFKKKKRQISDEDIVYGQKQNSKDDKKKSVAFLRS